MGLPTNPVGWKGFASLSIRNDPRAIGIFDSGLGGLTVARAVRDAFPHETICYLGDTARVPYGTKSADTVRLYAREDIAFLLSQGVKIVIAACNTVSAAALPEIQDAYDIPVVGVVEKGVEAVLESLSGEPQNAKPDTDPASDVAPLSSRDHDASPPFRIGVIGTETTISSEAYVRAIARRAPRAEVVQKACPLFVPLIEEGWLDRSVTRQVVEEYLVPMRRARIDALILGCTHYPLIAPLLAEFFGPEVRIVDSARAMVGALEQSFAGGDLAPAPEGDSGKSRYYVTDRYHHFRSLVRAFMGGDDLRVDLIPSEDLVAALNAS